MTRFVIWVFVLFLLAGCAAPVVQPTQAPPPPAASPTPLLPTPSPSLTPPPATRSAPTLLSPTTPPPTAVSTLTPTVLPTSAYRLLFTNAAGSSISILDPQTGFLTRIETGASPWGIALAGSSRVVISAAQGVSVVDLRQQKQTAWIPYRTPIVQVSYGEYRPGGMGIAAAPDGRRAYVGIYRTNQPSLLEVIDLDSGTSTASVEIGLRPFDVLVSRDGKEVYTLDHDSYTITVVDAASLKTRVIQAAPLGNGAFDKPHYAALRKDGRLLLPYQGRALLQLDPRSGAFTSLPLKADSHQHGIALTPDERRALIINTGPAGGAALGPGLSIVDLESGKEEIISLKRPHEKIAVSPDGRFAYLTAGYLLSGGSDGVSRIDLETRQVTELPGPQRPLDIAVIPVVTLAAGACELAKPGTAGDVDLALIAAAESGKTEEVRRLLSQGARPNAADSAGKTALIAAAYRNQVEAARLLIQAGWDVNLQDNSRQSAHLIPTADGFLDLLRLTLANGANVACTDSYNGTGLIRAADRGHVEIIRELLKTSIPVNHVNRLGWTALLEVIILGDGSPRRVDVVRLLLEGGADPNLPDSAGVTPLAHARQRGQTEVARLLEKAGGR